jgi:HK97 gp10 family phage protein
MPRTNKGFNTTLSLSGIEEYLERVAQAGRDVDEAAARALLEGAEVIQEAQRALAPVDTGNLREHIQIKGPEQDGNYIFVEVGVIHDRAFTDAKTDRYAKAQEFGWGDKKGYRAGHSFIRTGRDNSRARALAAMKASLERDGVL